MGTNGTTEEIERFLEEGKYTRVISDLEEHPSIITNPDLSILLIRAYRESSKYSKAKDLIQTVLESTKFEDKLNYFFQIMVEKLYILYREEKLAQAKLLINEIEKQISGIEKEELENRVLSLYHYVQGNLEILLKDGNTAKWQFQKAMEFCDVNTPKISCARNYNAMGNACLISYEYDKAEDWYTKCYGLAEKLQNFKFTIYSLNNLSNIHRLKGDILKALEFAKQSTQMVEKIENVEAKISILTNTGIIYYYLENISKGLEYLQKAYQTYTENTTGKLIVSETLFYLILTHLELGNDGNVEELIAEFGLIATNSETPIIELRYILLKTIVLDQSNDFKSKGIAMELLESIDEDILVNDEIFVITSISKLCNLLVNKLQVAFDFEIYERILELQNKLNDLIHNEDNVFLQIENLRLQAKIDQINLSLVEAKRKLLVAIEKAEQANLTRIKSDLERQLSTLNIKAETTKKEFKDQFEHEMNEPSEINTRDYKDRLYEYENFLHPIRLSIIKELYKSTVLNSSELRKELDVTWGSFLTHVKKLDEAGLIEYKDIFHEGSQIKILELTNKGYEKYIEFTEFIVSSI